MSSDLDKQIQMLSHDTSALNLTLDNIGAYVFIKDLQGRYTFVNKLVRKLFDCSVEEIIGFDDSHFFSISQSDNLMVNDRLVMDKGQSLEVEEKNVINKTGEIRYYWTVKKPIRDEQGIVTGMYGISTDITDRKLLELKLKANQELLDTVLNNVDAHIYMKDQEYRFMYINSKTADLLGIEPEEAIGKKTEVFLPEDVASDFDILDREVLSSGEKVTGEEVVFDNDGNSQHFWSTKVPIKNDQNEVTQYIGFSNDITELIQLKKNLEKLASTDDLTQLANRRSFLELSEAEFTRAKRYNVPMSFMAIDLDFFKKINDNYGHHVGDQVLKDIAKICADSLRTVDIIGRMGGEEFSILLPETDLSATIQMADRLRQLVQEYQLTGNWKKPITVSISIGITELGKEDNKLDELLIRADVALYKAKRSGRNQVCFL